MADLGLSVKKRVVKRNKTILTLNLLIVIFGLFLVQLLTQYRNLSHPFHVRLSIFFFSIFQVFLRRIFLCKK